MSPVGLSPSPTPSPTPAPASGSLPPERPPRAALRVNTSSLHPSVTNVHSQQRLRSNSAAQTHPTPPHPPAHSFSRSLSHNVVALSPQATSPVSHGSSALGSGRNDVAMAVNGLRATRQVPNSPTSPGRPQRPAEEEEVDEQIMIRKIREALEKSADNGDTLDLSRRGIDSIGPEAVEVFRKGVGTDMKGVWRLALSYNALGDGSIVHSFSRLSRLRYLNLKGNKFTQFPAALTEMVSLEILDLSKNAIDSFPEEPGRLSQLKVLSLTNNRINALPSYLTTFSHLKVFKVDQNPIEWPPRDILGSLMAPGHDARSRKDEDLRPWIENMKNWMRQRRTEEDASFPSEEEPISAVSTEASDLYRLHAHGSSRNNRLLSPIDARPATKAILRHRAATVSASGTSPQSPPPPSALTTSSSNPSIAPSIAQTTSASGHSRGASFTATQRMSASLSSKKSLPDLRQSHAKIIQDRQQDQAEGARPLGLGISASSRLLTPNVWQGSRAPVNEQRGGRTVADEAQEGPLADDRNSYFRRMSMLPASTISKAIPPELLQFVDAIRGILFALSQIHSALRQYLVFAVTDQVAGIFTRVMDPATTYMNTLINALDRFDSMSRRSTPPASVIKGVITSTKETVAVFAKVVAVLRLQMPALRGGDVRYTRTLLLMIYGSMAEIGASWKAMSPLMAEIRPLLSDGLHSFNMAPTSSLNGRTPISPIPEKAEMPTPQVGASATPLPEPTPSVTVATPPSRSRRQGGSFSTQDVEKGMLMSSPGAGHASDVGEDIALRHRPSGSTSQIVVEEDEDEDEDEAQDQDEDEDLMPLPVAPFVKQHRSGSSSGLSAMYSEGSQPQASKRGHLATSSSGSFNGPSTNNPRKLSVDVRPPTPASATLYDEDLLDVIETATEAGFTAWLRLAEDIGASSVNFGHSKSNSQSSISSQNGRINGFDRPPSIPVHYHTDLVRLLGQAEHTTSALRESLAGIRANPLTWSQSSLSDNAQTFIKTVIKVSELVKLISATHTFPQIVRQSLSRLTQATRECAILIQVSSLASTRAPSPAFSRGAAHPAESSTEDLTVPHSAGWNGPPSSGLRGLQLASRHALRRPNGSGGGGGGGPGAGASNGNGPRSAASQVAF